MLFSDTHPLFKFFVCLNLCCNYCLSPPHMLILSGLCGRVRILNWGVASHKVETRKRETRSTERNTEAWERYWWMMLWLFTSCFFWNLTVSSHMHYELYYHFTVIVFCHCYVRVDFESQKIILIFWGSFCMLLHAKDYITLFDASNKGLGTTSSNTFDYLV